MAAFVAKQMVGNKLNAVKAESSNKNCLLPLSYVKRILQSGLILDEDLEVLLNVFNSKEMHVEIDSTTCNSISRFTSGITFHSCIFATAGILSILLFQQRKVVYAGILSAVSGSILANRFWKVYLDKYYEKNGLKMIDLIRKLRKLHRNIIQYLKMRENVALDDLSEDLILFLKNVVQNEINIVEYLKKDLTFFMDCLSEESEKDLLVLEMDFELKNVLKEMQTIDDILILYFSKYLCYFGLCLLNYPSGSFINQFVPEFNANLQRTIQIIQNDFNRLKFKRNCIENIQINNQKDLNEKVARNLTRTLVDATININLINEKCRNLLSAIEEDQSTGMHQLGLISDLRDHALATYESLDVLCKLYGIICSRKSATSGQIAAVPASPGRQSTAVRFDDFTEPTADEKYELFIEQDSVNEVGSTQDNYSQSGDYLGLMLKELKQSLKKHQRFIEAKKRFHSDSSSGEEEAEEIPTFQKLSTEKKSSPLPPLPPQLPEMSAESFSAPISVLKSALDDIKAISGQRSVKEEVFGDDDDSDPDSSDCS